MGNRGIIEKKFKKLRAPFESSGNVPHVWIVLLMIHSPGKISTIFDIFYITKKIQCMRAWSRAVAYN